MSDTQIQPGGTHIPDSTRVARVGLDLRLVDQDHVVFSPTTWHRVPKCNHEDPRITIAFEVRT